VSEKGPATPRWVFRLRGLPATLIGFETGPARCAGSVSLSTIGWIEFAQSLAAVDGLIVENFDAFQHQIFLDSTPLPK
jgi:hypothetical protein